MSQRRGMTWSLDVEVVDKGSKKELAELSRAQENAARESIAAAQKIERAAASEADAVRDAAKEKRAVAEKVAAEASRAAAAEVKAAREAQRANSDAARKRLSDARAVAAAALKASRASDQEARAAEKSARDRERAADRATKAVTAAQRDHQRAAEKVQQTERDLADESEQQAKRTAKAWSGVKDRIGNAFEGLGGKGKAGLIGVGAAGGAALVSGMSAYMGREGTAKRLAAQLGIPDREARRIGSSVGKLYVQGFGESRDAVAEVAVDVARNLGDLTGRELKRATGTTIQISELFDTDSAELSRSVGSMLKNGLASSADEALDAITVGFQRGANAGDELLDTLNEYAEPMKSLGIDAGTFTAMLVKGADQGVWSIDKLGDAYKEFSIRAVDGSTASVDAYHALGLSAREYEQEILAGGDSAKRATSAVIDALRGVSDPVKREAAGVALFGTMWEDVGGDIIMSLDPAKASIEGTAGAARELGEAFNTPGQRLEAFKRKATDSLVNFIGAEALPVLEDLGRVAEEHWPEIRDEIEPVAVAVKDVTREVAEFVGEHPGLLKVAAAGTAIAAAAKTIKFVGAITGVNSLLRGMRRLLPIGRKSGAELGTSLGTELASSAGSSARGGLRKGGALTGGLKGRMRSVGSTLGGWLGIPMGKTAADKGADGLSKSGAITGKAGGRMNPIGRSLGVLLGAALAAAAINELTKAITGSSITEQLKRGMGLDGAPSGGGLPENFPKKPAGEMTKREREIAGWISRAYGGATGGRLTNGGFRRFAAGGLVASAVALGVPGYAAGGMIPALVSSGEAIREPNGSWWEVPGQRVAADNVFTWLKKDTEVYTDHGQSLLMAGASRDEALDMQVPHFREGGKPGKKKRKPLRSARVGATVFDDPPPGAFGGLSNGYAELGTAKRTDGSATGFGWIAKALGLKGELPANTPLAITINGRTHTLRKRDRGYGQGGDGKTSDPSWALDIWKDSWSKFGINGNWKGQAEVALGTAAQLKEMGSTGRDYSYTVARSVGRSSTRGGLLEDPYSPAFGAVEAFGSRAAARRAGALTAPIRSALDDLKDSYTRKIERSAPSSRSGASRGSAGRSSASGAAAAGGWTRPVGGPITSRFGMRGGRMHKGIDFGVGVGPRRHRRARHERSRRVGHEYPRRARSRSLVALRASVEDLGAARNPRQRRPGDCPVRQLRSQHRPAPAPGDVAKRRGVQPRRRHQAARRRPARPRPAAVRRRRQGHAAAGGDLRSRRRPPVNDRPASASAVGGGLDRHAPSDRSAAQVAARRDPHRWRLRRERPPTLGAVRPGDRPRGSRSGRPRARWAARERLGIQDDIVGALDAPRGR